MPFLSLVRKGAARSSFARRHVPVSLLSLSLLLTLLPAARATIQLRDEPATTARQSAAANQDAKDERVEFVPGEVLVRFRPGSAVAAETDTASASLPLSTDDGRALAVEVERLDAAPELVEGLRKARVSEADTLDAVAALAARPDVLYAEPNYIWRANAIPNDPRFAEMYNLRNTGQGGGTPDADIDADEAWDLTTGSGNVVVGVVDTGIDINHPDLQANIWVNPADPLDGVDNDGNGFIDDTNGWDFNHNDRTVYDPTDTCSSSPGRVVDDHGTHVAGTIGAAGNNGVGVTGVNWQVKLMSLKFLGPCGSGPTSAALAGINYAVQMKSRGVNIRVLNNSWGGGGQSQALLDAITAANNADILFVAAAGNDGTDNDDFPHYPSNYNAPNVVAVARTTSLDNLSLFSNFGPRTVHVGAPGSGILSTTPNNTYSFFSGTSMAAPHVSGVAALVLARQPSIPVARLRAALIHSGDATGTTVPTTGRLFGARRLNARKALENADEFDAAPPSISDFAVASRQGRSINFQYRAGDDGFGGTPALVAFTFNAPNGSQYHLGSFIPANSFENRTLSMPVKQTSGTVVLRVFDNAGNEAVASLPISINADDADPYVVSTGPASALSTGGLALGINGDDVYRQNVQLGINLPYFGQTVNTVTLSSNGALYFSPPRPRSDGSANDVPSNVADLNRQRMIAGLWDDIDLRTCMRPDADIYVVTFPNNRVIYRWQGIRYLQATCPATPPPAATPINFEIELRGDGTIITRYGEGNANLNSVVGISNGQADTTTVGALDAYIVASHTATGAPISLGNAQTVTFAPRQPAAQQFTISGFVRSSGEFFTDTNGVTVTLGGAQSATTQTDASGFYRFPNLPAGGNYTVTPSKPGAVFNPASASFNSLSQNQTADFNAEALSFQISGQVKDPNGNPIAGIPVNLGNGLAPDITSPPTSTQTDAGGNFSFRRRAGGNYWVGVPQYITNPPFFSVANLNADQSVVFVARRPTISGRVTDGAGNGIGAASVELNNGGISLGTTTSDAEGRYSFANVIPSGNYTLIPSKPGQFTAFARTVNNVTADTTVDLTLIPFITVSGQVRDSQGNVVPNVGFNVTGLSVTHATNPQGNYSVAITPRANAPITITPIKYGYTFSPPSVTFDNLGVGNQAVNFTGALNNPIDASQTFVRQHYLDFLNREPDPMGLFFWTNGIETCGTSLQCTEVKRVDTSAAFFLSIEFQETGYLVYRVYKAAYGDINPPTVPVPVRRADFVPDALFIGQGVQVGVGNWQQQLEANKVAYTNNFVGNQRFIALYPLGMNASDFVDGLFAKAGIVPTALERQAAINSYGAGDTAGRAAALRSVAESQTLRDAEFRKAFVLMQYFGYLRRDPDALPDTNFDGYIFWLGKLNQFNGNFRAAEMVKAFIASIEYNQRFRP